MLNDDDNSDDESNKNVKISVNGININAKDVQAKLDSNGANINSKKK